MRFGADLSVECQHCGSVDVLPSDEAGRVLEVRSRLALAEERALQVRGMDATLATIFEDRMAFARVSGLYLAMAFVIVAMVAAQWLSFGALPALAPPALADMLLAQATAPMLMLGVGLSFALALGYGRSHYRKMLRPLLIARIAREPGARARCRVCGGELPEARSVDVRCEYCRSLNLVPRVLHASQSSALAAEADALRAKLAGVNLATLSIARRMRSAWIVCVALSIAVALALPALGQVWLREAAP
jgi:hypothetical protein